MAHRLRDRTVEEDASTGQLGEDFRNARCLWNAEVMIILDHDHKQRISDTDTINNTDRSDSLINTTLVYVRSLNNYPNKESIDEAHNLLTKYSFLSEWELALINNLRIDDTEECFALIPTLKLKVNQGLIQAEQVTQLLNDLKRYQL